ncbi:MAG: UDP-3-O-(3-hydroxymyristoyl)glucosamine N-acyltransferase [Gammaproteobacteria bacterium]
MTGASRKSSAQSGLFLSEIVERLRARLWREGQDLHARCSISTALGEVRIQRLATLTNAEADCLSFLANPLYRSALETTRAGAVLLRESDAAAFPGVAIVVPDPYVAYAQASQWFVRPRAVYPSNPSPPVDLALTPLVHTTALVDPSAVIDSSAVIGPFVSIGAETRIGAGVVIDANVTLGARCVVGEGTRLSAGVVFYDDVRVGVQCCVHSGAVLGADGFGFARTASGWLKIAQLGGVYIGDRVEIGANTCIDRGALDDTVIESGVIIDNHVQVAHNCHIGENTAIAGCVGIAGSTRVGANCTLAGQAGLAGHIELASGTHVGMQAQVTRSIERPGQYASGTGLWPQKKWRRLVARWRRAL